VRHDVHRARLHLLGDALALRGIAGATDLGDQEAVLVLDASAIVDDATRRREVV